tara:strand:- start:81 stop:302 length:222 start_codon:yes stop_codon:yes gene_type:complete
LKLTNNFIISNKIKKPSINALTFFLPAILFFSKEGKHLYFICCNSILIGNSTQNVKSFDFIFNELNEDVFPIR